jgi:hypothetical protein
MNNHVADPFRSILAGFYRVRMSRPSVLHRHETIMVCPTCGAAMTYEPPDPRDEERPTIGVLGCSECGHGEPAECVREYEAARNSIDD